MKCERGRLLAWWGSEGEGREEGRAGGGGGSRAVEAPGGESEGGRGVGVAYSSAACVIFWSACGWSSSRGTSAPASSPSMSVAGAASAELSGLP